MKWFTTFVFLLLIGANYGQSPLARFHIEPGVNFAHVHHHLCALEDKAIHRGYGTGASLRLAYNFDRSRIVTGIVGNTILRSTSYIPFELGIPLTYQFDFWKAESIHDFGFFAEAGAQLHPKTMTIGSLTYVGGHYAITEGMKLFVRIEAPALSILTDQFGLHDMYRFGIEASVAIQLDGKRDWLPQRKRFSGKIPCVRV